jgi:hypothetical protein
VTLRKDAERKASLNNPITNQIKSTERCTWEEIFCSMTDEPENNSTCDVHHCFLDERNTENAKRRESR